jgi:para-aminobenzoate synthetase component 1
MTMTAPGRSQPARLEPTVRLEPLPGLGDARPIDVAEALRPLGGLALLESGRPGRNARWTFLTADPLLVLEAPSDGPDPLTGARAQLARVSRGPLRAGPAPDGNDVAADVAVPPFLGGLVGYLGYDLGRRLERIPALAAADQDLPDLRLALHDWVVAWDHRTGRAWLGGRALDGNPARLARRLAAVRERLADRAASAGPDPAAAGSPLRMTSGLDRPTYLDRVEAVRHAIARGEVYQANMTRRLEVPFRADPWPLQRRLRVGDPARFSAYLDLGPAPADGAPRAILSASPEPFLRTDAAGRVWTDPIKGTRPRGATPDEDRALACELLASAKDRAENTMIVDVLRNDLGRVCQPGSVRVPRLCRLERTAAVQHLVSTVTGRLARGRDALHLVAASFPGGSITGAPKIRAMELLETLEPVRRGPYSGALGWFGPDGAMATSILIRTFVADGTRLTLHVGGGITWPSDPAAEWDETVAKARGPLEALGAIEVEAGR